MSKRIFCLLGPTASGKTALACELVNRFPFEIISVDSVMIYRGMDIGSAKPSQSILQYAPHHLIDILNPPEPYSAAHFCKDANACSIEIMQRGRIPLLVGGTMMYFHAFQQGLSDLPEADEAVRAALLHEANERGWEHLHQRLKRIDPITAARIHPHDAQRIQRALEVYQLTQKPLSQWIQSKKETEAVHFVNLALMPECRAMLHQQITKRFEYMLDQGLVDEVKCLLKTWELTLHHPAMRSVGYRQVFEYLRGDYDYATLQAKGIAATRQLAKRQLTWLRKWNNIQWFPAENPTVQQEVMAIVEQILDNS